MRWWRARTRRVWRLVVGRRMAEERGGARTTREETRERCGGERLVSVVDGGLGGGAGGGSGAGGGELAAVVLGASGSAVAQRCDALDEPPPRMQAPEGFSRSRLVARPSRGTCDEFGFRVPLGARVARPAARPNGGTCDEQGGARVLGLRAGERGARGCTSTAGKARRSSLVGGGAHAHAITMSAPPTAETTSPRGRRARGRGRAPPARRTRSSHLDTIGPT